MNSNMQDFKPKSFWQRPEGTTGTIFLVAAILGGGFLLYSILPTLIVLAQNTLYFALLMAALAGVVYMVIDPRMRNLVWYGYKSVMRAITGLFVQIDPIGILQSYVEDLRDNLRKMNKQIGNLRGQMHKLSELINNNKRQIQSSLSMANQAKEKDKRSVMVLQARKAGRLQESNIRLEDLYKKMEILYRVLIRMYENSEILLEDVNDQVQLKKQEREAIRASHSAMQSAMNILSGNNDKRQMFDMALEAVADDVGKKIGEMERFMDLSTNFMDSIDLQNGVFEEEGMKLLDQWEKEGESLLLGNEKQSIILKANSESEVLDLNAPVKAERPANHSNQYNELFNF
jgi:phage shock protein A